MVNILLAPKEGIPKKVCVQWEEILGDPLAK